MGTKRKPNTIGEIIISEFIELNDKTKLKELFDYIDLPDESFKHFFNHSLCLTDKTVIKLAEFFGTSTEFWSNLNKLNLEWYIQNEQTSFDPV